MTLILNRTGCSDGSPNSVAKSQVGHQVVPANGPGSRDTLHELHLSAKHVFLPDTFKSMSHVRKWKVQVNVQWFRSFWVILNTTLRVKFHHWNSFQGKKISFPIFLFRIAKVVRDARWGNWASIVLLEFPCNGQIVESGAFISMNRPESQWRCTKRISVPNSPQSGKTENWIKRSTLHLRFCLFYTHTSYLLILLFLSHNWPALVLVIHFNRVAQSAEA